MRKFLVIFFAFALFFFSSNYAFAVGTVKAFILYPSGSQSKYAPELDRDKQYILNGLNLVRQFYSDKLSGKTFNIDPTVDVLPADSINGGPGVVRDQDLAMCPADYFMQVGFTGKPPILKMPAALEQIIPGTIFISFMVGSGDTPSDCADSNDVNIKPYGRAWMNHQTLLDLGSSGERQRIAVIYVSHELGHTFGLISSDYADGHSCSILSKDECKYDVGGSDKPFPPGTECLNSVMGAGGNYCRDGDKRLVADWNSLGFDNSVWNPELKTLLNNPLLGGTGQTIITVPTPPPSPGATISPTFSPTPSPTPTLLPTPSPSNSPSPTASASAPSTPTPPPSPGATISPTFSPTPSPSTNITQIRVSNYQDFSTNSSGDDGSTTQDFFTSATTQIAWTKSTLNPSGPVYIAPTTADGINKEILVVSLSGGQTYQVPNSPFVITAKVIRKIVKMTVSYNDGQSLLDVPSPYTQAIPIRFSQKAGVSDYRLTINIQFNDGSSKDIPYDFIYNTSGSVTPSPGAPTPSLSPDEAYCHQLGGVCQASCSGEFTAQVGTCPSKGQPCCSKPVPTPAGGVTKCPGGTGGPVSNGWGGVCKPFDTDKVLLTSDKTACTVASCYLDTNLTPNEYCWYNSGQAYPDYNGCWRNGQGVQIITPAPAASAAPSIAPQSSTPATPAAPAFAKTGPCYQPGYDSNICGSAVPGAGGQCDSLGQQSSVPCTKTCPNGTTASGTSTSTCGADGCYTNSCSCNAFCSNNNQ